MESITQCSRRLDLPHTDGSEMARLHSLVEKVWLFGVAVVFLMVANGCASHSPQTRPLDQILAGGFDAKAKQICTTTGASTLPMTGSPRTVAASDSTVAEAKSLVNSGSEKLFGGQIGKLNENTYVALCFIQGEKSFAPPNGRLLAVELPGGEGSTIVGLW